MAFQTGTTQTLCAMCAKGARRDGMRAGPADLSELLDGVAVTHGPVSHDEAEQILLRFNASHWDNGHEKARYTIPADPQRDDDIRLSAYIAHQRARDAEVAALRQIISDAAREVGAQVSPECSLEFMALLPREIALALRRAEGGR